MEYNKLPLLDSIKITELQGILQDNFKELVNVFIEDSKNNICEIKIFLKTNNIESLMKNAHSLKGASANMGASQLSCIALHIEEACKNNDLHLVHIHLHQMEKNHTYLTSRLQKLL